jgi:hypothetical protein
MKLKYVISIGYCLFLFNTLQAQFVIQNGATIYANGASIALGMDLINDGILQHDTASECILNGSNVQIIGGNSTSQFGKLIIDNAQGVLVNKSISVSNKVQFVQGVVNIGSQDVTLLPGAMITGYHASNYFINNGIGNLFQQVNQGETKIFPLGSSTSYTPISFTNHGVSDQHSLRILDQVFPQYDINTGLGLSTPLATQAVRKTCIVNEQTPGGANFDISFQWNTSDHLPGFYKGAAQLRQFNYTTNTWLANANYQNANGINPYTLSANFSGIADVKNLPIGVFSQNIPLPIHDLQFTARKDNQDVVLNWKTSFMESPKEFDVQRSWDGKQFVTIGTLNSNVLQSYEYVDEQAILISQARQTPVIYYRIVYKEIDATLIHSHVVRVFVDEDTPLVAVWPNPVMDVVHLQWNSEKNETTILILLDEKGRTLASQTKQSTIGNNQHDIDMRAYAKGVYTLVMQDQYQRKLVQKIVK